MPWLGLVLALVVVVFSAPPQLIPVLPLRAVQETLLQSPLGWLTPPVVASLALVVSALCLPRAPREADAGGRPLRPELSAFGVGALLVLEPLIHLALLGWVGFRSLTDPTDVALPLPVHLDEASFRWRVAVLSLLVPLAEEFFFRGRLLPFIQARLGAVSAVSLSALSFAVAHGDVDRALVALPLGVLLGLLRLHGRNLGACVVVHQMHNGLFLLAGPAVIATPWVAVLLTTVGVGLMAGGAWWRLRERLRRTRIVVWTLTALAVVAAGYPLYTQVQDVLWTGAAHRAVVMGRRSDDELVVRLDWSRRTGRLAAGRGEALGRLLLQKPCARPIRQAWALAIVAPSLATPPALEGDDDQAAYLVLADLAACPVDSPALLEGVHRIALEHPEALARHASDNPEHVARWYRLPMQGTAVAEQLRKSSPFQRRRLLASMERSFPGRIGAVIGRLPADEVGPMERRHLRAFGYGEPEAQPGR